MSEATIKSFDPLAYHVNDVDDFDEDVVIAYKNKDKEAIKRISHTGIKTDLDFFICVNNHWHAFILCVPKITDLSDVPFHPFKDKTEEVDNPFLVEDVKLCWKFELCFASEQLRTYKIRKMFQMYKDIKHGMKRTYYIGRYEDVHAKALQLSALRAAPYRYSALLDDCVEFAKAFCIESLALCSNWRDIEAAVHENISQATASGLSVENLSRRVQSSGWFAGRLLQGGDFTSLLGDRNKLIVGILAVIFFLVYPFIIIRMFVPNCENK